MAQFIENLQYKIKSSSNSLALVTCKFIVGFILGLTFSLVGQRMIGYGSLAYFFVIITSMAVFQRLSRQWRWSGLFVFSLICVLIALLLRMYILIAPGA